MRYFCSFAYSTKKGPGFGNCVFDSHANPDDDMGEFHESLRIHIKQDLALQDAVLLFYKQLNDAKNTNSEEK